MRAAVETGRHPDRQAENEAHQYRSARDSERRSCAEHHAIEEVAAKLVSAEPMQLRGRAQARGHGHPSPVIGGNDKRGDNRNQNHRDHQRCAEEPFGGEEAPHLFLREPDLRIENHVEQIDREVGEHDDGRDDENRRLD